MDLARLLSLSSIKTILALGLYNVIRVLIYRGKIRLGFRSICVSPPELPKGLFFCRHAGLVSSTPARLGWYRSAQAFGRELAVIQGAPKWQAGCFSGKIASTASLEWWKIADFD